MNSLLFSIKKKQNGEIQIQIYYKNKFSFISN